ncbi:MAG TPA: hypothetical protein VMY42_20915 [Thermoguttaceae bacterium]|nr:hypothetical protein [Thermoguttaceae bacterium]
MKKIKLNVDKEAIQTFFLEHVEKIVFGVVVIGFVFMVLKAQSREPIKQTEDELSQNAANARRHWENETPKDPKVEAFDYAEIVDRIVDIPVDESAYAHRKPWVPVGRDTRGVRAIPELMPVAELRGTAGHGPVMRKEKNVRISHKDVRWGLRWAVITGMVPTEAQMAAFSSYYSTRKEYNPATDVASYVTYEVERAEVADPSLPADQLQWIRALPTANGNASLVEWSKAYRDLVVAPRGAPGGAKGGPGEVFPAEFLDDVLTSPLLHLVDQAWDFPSIGHPRIALLTETPEGGLEGETDGGTEPMGVGLEGHGAFEGGTPEADPAAGEEEAAPQEKLFRFFDFTVQPGKRYRYRVRLILKNPNFKVEPKYLDDEADLACLVPESTTKPGEVALDTCELIVTPWSVETGVISVPHDTQLLALSVAQPLKAGGAPSGRMMVLKWVNQEGIEAYKEFGVERGDVANIPEQVFPDTGRRDDREPTTKKTDELEQIKLDYMTEAVVLDVRGGEVLPGRGNQSTPGQILVMDADGNLTVQDEMQDLALVRRVKGIESSTPTTPKAGPGGILPIPPPPAEGGGDLHILGGIRPAP